MGTRGFMRRCWPLSDVSLEAFVSVLQEKGFPEASVELMPGMATKRQFMSVLLETVTWGHFEGEAEARPPIRNLEIAHIVRRIIRPKEVVVAGIDLRGVHSLKALPERLGKGPAKPTWS